MKHTLHVAIVMDGNGRWATRRGLPRTSGHRAGAQGHHGKCDCQRSQELIGGIDIQSMCNARNGRPLEKEFWLRQCGDKRNDRAKACNF